MNFILAGQTVSLVRNSRVKKMMTAWSITLMIFTMRGNSWSSSEVEMMNVSVETTTAESEARAGGMWNQTKLT